MPIRNSLSLTVGNYQNFSYILDFFAFFLYIVVMVKVLGRIVKAIKEYNMIEDGDNIVVGLSGGKDSLLLIASLAEYKKHSKHNFSLSAITIDLGFEGSDFSKLKAFASSLEVPLTIHKSDIYDVVFNIRKEKNPCSLCAKMRRGILCSEAANMGANKVALGHHQDDLIETFFLSLIYEGRLSTFSPVSFMDRTEITVIRPMILVDEEDIKRESKNLPIFFNPCPADKHTKREEVKDLVKHIMSTNKTAKKNILSAITSPERYNLWDKTKR